MMNTNLMRNFALIVLSVAVSHEPAMAQCAFEVAKLTASDGMALDGLGISVAINGNVVVVGSPGVNDFGDNTGALYVYPYSEQGWLQKVKITRSDGQAGNSLGITISMSDNNRIASRLLWLDEIHIFEIIGGVWQDVALLRSNDHAPLDEFGFSLDIEGDVLVAGAPGDNDLGGSSGSAYVFERDAQGQWNQTAKLLASDGDGGDAFGFSIALKNNIIVVGARDDDDPNGNFSGSAYVFEKDPTGQWVQTLKLLPNVGQVIWSFGEDVAIGRDGNEDIILIGEPHVSTIVPSGGAVIVFERDGNGSWVQTAELVSSDVANSDTFGRNLDMSGNIAVIASRGADVHGINTGAAYIFRRENDGSWTEVQKIFPSVGNTRDWFGFSVAVDGTNTVIGAFLADANATDSGAAYVFDFSACLPCLVDLNADGSVDVLDFFAFITLFATSDPAADLNTDGNIDVLDFFEFVNLFNTGCP